MGTTLATYYAKLQDMPDSEYKVEILEDGPIKKIAVNGKIYEVDYNMGGDSIHSIIIDHHSHGVQISPSSNNSYVKPILALLHLMYQQLKYIQNYLMIFRVLLFLII